MWRLTMAGVVVLAGFAPSAPRPKDLPKKDRPLVGEWLLCTINGRFGPGRRPEGFVGKGTVLEVYERVRAKD
jgi:hypothetical protein